MNKQFSASKSRLFLVFSLSIMACFNLAVILLPRFLYGELAQLPIPLYLQIILVCFSSILWAAITSFAAERLWTFEVSEEGICNVYGIRKHIPFKEIRKVRTVFSPPAVTVVGKDAFRGITIPSRWFLANRDALRILLIEELAETDPENPLLLYIAGKDGLQRDGDLPGLKL